MSEGEAKGIQGTRGVSSRSGARRQAGGGLARAGVRWPHALPTGAKKTIGREGCWAGPAN